MNESRYRAEKKKFVTISLHYLINPAPCYFSNVPAILQLLQVATRGSHARRTSGDVATGLWSSAHSAAQSVSLRPQLIQLHRVAAAVKKSTTEVHEISLETTSVNN